MADVFYNNFFEEAAEAFYQGKGSVGTFKMALMTSSYTPDADNHAFYSDLTNEASGSGYTSGGNAVANLTITQDNTNDRANVDFDDVTFTGVSLTDVDSFVLYEDTGTASTSTLILYAEFSEGAQTFSGDITVSPPAAGVHTIG